MIARLRNLAPDRRRRRRLLCGGALAGPLFVGAFTALGASRAGYDARIQPVSALAVGRAGWLQRANFAITGLLYIAGAGGLRGMPKLLAGSSATPVLVGAAGVDLVGSGVFVGDPSQGSPAAEATTTSTSRAEVLHSVFALPIFLGTPAAALLSARGFARRDQRGWARYSRTAGTVMLGAFGCFSAAFAGVRPLVAWGGLIQRVSIVAGFGWLSAILARAWRAA